VTLIGGFSPKAKLQSLYSNFSRYLTGIAGLCEEAEWVGK